MKIQWNEIWQNIRKYVLNKYVLTCLIFAVVLTFCGEQSLINRRKLQHQIDDLQDEISLYKQKLNETRESIQFLDSGREQLEKYARERYQMHAEGEDLYIIEE